MHGSFKKSHQSSSSRIKGSSPNSVTHSQPFLRKQSVDSDLHPLEFKQQINFGKDHRSNGDISNDKVFSELDKDPFEHKPNPFGVASKKKSIKQEDSILVTTEEKPSKDL